MVRAYPAQQKPGAGLFEFGEEEKGQRWSAHFAFRISSVRCNSGEKDRWDYSA
jgi:hypothetical protein